MSDQGEAMPSFELPIPATTWFDIFCFIDREQLVNRVAMVNQCFMSLADRRLHKKCSELPNNNTRLLRPFNISYEPETPIACPFMYINTDPDTCYEFPKCALPENIVGFKTIELEYFDAKVLNFFSLLRPVLKQLNICIMGLGEMESPYCDMLALEQLFRYCYDIEIRSLTVDFCNGWLNFCKICAKFPEMMAQLRILNIGWDRNIPEYMETATIEAKYWKSTDRLLNWLSIARADGAPKLLMLKLYDDRKFKEFILRFKESFLHATAQSPFIFRVKKIRRKPFNAKLLLDSLNNLNNGKTGEELTVQQVQKDKTHELIIKRHRIGQKIDDDQNWRELAMLDWDEAFGKRQTIIFGLHSIGNVWPGVLRKRKHEADNDE